MKQAKSKDTTEKIDPNFAPIVNAFAGYDDVVGGKLMASYGLKVNRKIFAMFSRGRFVAKLPKNRVDELVSQGKGERFDPGHGRLMKEWVQMESGKAEWLGLAKEAYEFVKRGKA